mgnify:CR=1 FL=1
MVLVGVAVGVADAMLVKVGGSESGVEATVDRILEVLVGGIDDERPQAESIRIKPIKTNRLPFFIIILF